MEVWSEWCLNCKCDLVLISICLISFAKLPWLSFFLVFDQKERKKEEGRGNNKRCLSLTVVAVVLVFCLTATTRHFPTLCFTFIPSYLFFACLPVAVHSLLPVQVTTIRHARPLLFDFLLDINYQTSLSLFVHASFFSTLSFSLSLSLSLPFSTSPWPILFLFSNQINLLLFSYFFLSSF